MKKKKTVKKKARKVKGSPWLITPTFEIAFPEIVASKESYPGSGIKEFRLLMMFSKNKSVAQYRAETKGIGGRPVSPDVWDLFKSCLVDGASTGSPRMSKYWIARAKCRADFPPGLVDANCEPVSGRAFYPRAFARACIGLVPWEYSLRKGTLLSLRSLQKVRDAEPEEHK